MKLGWIKDKFDPDAVYHYSLSEIKKLVTLPAKVNLERYLPPDAPWDQGNKGACTGFGIAMNLTMRAIEQKIYHKLNQRFSPEWIYDGERALEGTLKEDSGAEPTDGWKWLKANGCLPEQYLPYTEETLSSIPALDLISHTKDWPLSGYVRAVDGVRGLQTSLAVGNMISIGTPWYDKWMDVKKDGMLPDITNDDDIVGGHETCLIGYQTIKGKLYFRGINSWGKSFGDNGLYWMPASSIKIFKASGRGYDAQFPKLNWH